MVLNQHLWHGGVLYGMVIYSVAWWSTIYSVWHGNLQCGQLRGMVVCIVCPDGLHCGMVVYIVSRWSTA